MRTLVVSDLHLGGRTGVDVLRRPAALEALLDRLDGADRLVLLGDVLELRHGPARDALAAAEPVLRAIGGRLRGGEVVLLAGNHDHGLVAPWLERRGREGRPPPLGLEERAGPGASAATEAIARALGPAALDVAYPGVWLSPDAYATHGHYLDRHLTMPTMERLAAGVMARMLGARTAVAASPDDYELVLAPMYALLEAVAARTQDSRASGHTDVSTRAWQALATDGARSVRGRLLAAGLSVGVLAVNRAGVGPVRADLTTGELRRAGLRAMRDVVGRLGIPARHVVFGHTHRAGPLPGDDAADWALPGGGRLLNTGSWVYERVHVGRGHGGPYWPGGAVELVDGEPPRHVRLLDDVRAERLTA
ncbi:MAG: hypothetical protein QOD44_149 [Solirubrobacteraceae bacterium]|nr:hypothetical protein [Solirubrobacteraceae bacterium]